MKTIRLSSEMYRLTKTDSVEAFYSTDTGYQPDYENPDFTAELEKCRTYAWHSTKYAVGTDAVLVSTTDVSPHALRAGTHPKYWLSFDLDGVRGNMDSSIKRTIGWRGTSNDRCVDAHGVVTIRKIRTLKNGDVAVTVS